MAKKILITKKEVRERNRELAKERMLETKKKDMKTFKGASAFKETVSLRTWSSQRSGRRIF